MARSLEEPLELDSLVPPRHVAIIMDGNGRWARKRGLPRQAGHRAGAENLRHIIRACVEFNIKILTIYAFSTENWGRPKTEIQALMKIFARVLDKETDELNAQGVCVHHLGELTGVDPKLQEKVHRALELTRNNDRLILNVAFNYGGRAEILFVRAGTLDDPAAVSPDVHIYTRSKLPWIALPAGVPAFEAYYETAKLWPAESIARRKAALG